MIESNAAGKTGDNWRRGSFRAMNTDIEYAVQLGSASCYEPSLSSASCNDPSGPERLIRDWFASAECRFSRFRADSELSRINRSGGAPVLVSETMLEVLLLAENYRDKTNGMFSPLLLQALEQAGYNRSFELLAAEPASAVNVSGQGITTADGLSLALNPRMRAVRLPVGAGLDLGGIVKGWAAERLAGWLRERRGCSRGYVNAGGDVRVWGGAGPAEPWMIAAADPYSDRDAAALRLTDGAVATSSVCGRRWQTATGGWAHHLIDPRTMRPGTGDVVQCTVAGPSLPDCEVAAKVICLLGAAAGAAWLAQAFPQLTALLFTTDGEIRSIRFPSEVRVP